MNRRILSFLSVALVFAGCKSTGVDRASSVAGGLRASAAELEKSKVTIDAAISSLNALDAKGDLKTQYKAYSGSVDALDARANYLRDLRAGVKAKEGEFVSSWQMNEASITNPDLRKKSEERKNELVKRLQSLSGKADEARLSYDSMMKDLRDVQSYLSHDLTAAGLDAVSSPKKDATKTSAKLKEQMDAIIVESKKLADEIDVPAPPPPAPAK